jgi:hypothetical protein
MSQLRVGLHPLPPEANGKWFAAGVPRDSRHSDAIQKILDGV